MANLDPYVVGNASKNIVGCVLVTHRTMSPKKIIAANLVHKKASKLSPSNSSAYNIVHESLTSAESSPSAGGWVWNLSGKSAREEITKVK